MNSQITKTVTNLQLFELQAALLSLDGVQHSAPGADGTTVTRTTPYKFSGATRLAIAKNLKVVNDEVKTLETTRERIRAEVGNGTPATPNTPEWGLFVQKWTDVLNGATEIEVVPIPPADLNLDTNAIPPSAVAKLIPAIVAE